MSVNDSTTSSDSTARSELLFLIAKFLSNGPCKQAADVLMRELEIHELIPKGYDWEGNQRNRSYDQLARLNSHVGPDHLLHMCQRLGPLLDQVVPTNTHGVRSMLGAGRMSLLRTPESISNPSWKLSHQMVLQNGYPRVKPKNLMKLSVVQSLHARQAAGAGMTASSIPTCLYSKVTMIDRKLGHLSSVYCVTYDRTGDFIITGADDSLVKIWHARSGRLMATLRGHAAEITDMTVNQENTLLATGSMDKSVRVWSLRTKATVAVLHGHTGYITTIQFSPQCKGNVRILMSSGYDGSVCFWLWDVNTHQFNLKPKKFVERSHAGAQMLCSSFSPGGMFVATGNSDNVIRVYFLYASEPNKICELEAHTNKVDSICYSNSFNRFVSGSEDGTARIWHYERQEWRATILSMYTRLNSDGTEVMAEEPIRAEDKLRVTMVSWNLDDTLVVTAVSDFSVKVWNSNTGKLLHVLKEHDGDVFVLDAHPMDPRILLSAGHDGNIVLWDIAEGVKIKNFFNTIQGQGNGAVYDCKFTPDGQSFAATDNHGHLLFFGFGVNEKIKQVPHEVYFHTDYRPLIRDANNFVLDEQTQQPPHLMPPPFLVNIDGNPYPPALQRLVPGREQLNNSQLVPEIAVNEAGNSEVIGEQDDQARAEMPLPEADIPAGREVEAGEAEAPVAQQAAVVPHRQDHDYSRQRAEGEGAEPAPQQNGGRVQEGDDDDDTEDEDGGRLGRLEERARPSIDELIRQLQQEQDERILAEGGALPLASPPPPAADAVPEAREGRVGMRRAGEMEGVRQLGNMQQRAASSGLPAWSKSVLVQPLSHAILKTSEARRLALADDETIRYILERKKKQSVPNTPSTLFGNMSRGKQQLQAKVEEKKKRSQLEQTARNRLTTRALYDTEEEEEETDESDRESNNSSYSDWTMEGSSNLQPPKRRSQRKPKHRQISSDDDDDDDEDEAIEIEYDDDDEEEEAVEDDHDEEYKAYLKRPKKVEKTEEVKEEGKKKGPPTAPKTKKPKKPSKKRKADSQKASASTPAELDQRYLPPEWLTGTIPRKTPYVPQMGDELMYFRQGHELYLQAVEKHKSYKLGSNISLPWHKNPQLREMELVKIVGLRYEVKPPRLCSLKLAYINWDTGKMLGGSFSIRYHDMPDVIDFLVLRQHFDIARRRNWKPGDRFRSMIDDQWWMGEIESQSPLNMMFPDSMFQCFFVHWDNGEYERLSPWDMEPINENLMPTSIGGGVPADPEELKDMLYTPKPCEWSSAGREAETERILRGLEAVMEHSVAEPFNAPVDLSAFPEYARSIEYTIDLSTIKARLENGYYRRINALQWDIRHVESNAKKFNEDGTPIFRSAGIVTDTLLRFISDPSCEDPMPILEELSGGQEFNWGNGDADDTEDEDEGASASSSTRRKRGGEGRGSRRQRGEPPPDPEEWKKRCADLLAFMQDCEDAAPFKDPVDLELYPNYLAVIETPMDLGTVGSKLSSGRYASPVDFAEDVRLIFHNSRSFNTNKRSRIYSMTLRLSAMFEEQVKTVLSSWSAVTRNKTSGSGSRRPSAWSAAVHSGGQSAHSGGQSVCSAADTVSGSQTHQPSGSRSGTSVALRSHTLGRSSEERARGAASTRRGVSRVVSDSDKTEVEEEEETEAAGRDSSDKENYNEDEDTEVEEDESEASTLLSKNSQPAVSAHGRSTSTLNSHKCVSNGHTSYRTRAKTGSLRPKRYMSTDEEEERDTRKNSKRARSYSSRESSLHLADEEDNESTDNSSGESETHSDSDSRTSKTRKHKSKAVKHKRRKTATRSRSRNSKKRRRREFSSGDEDNESEEETEESDSSDSESEEELVHKPKPKSRSEVNIDKCALLKKHTSSGKRTTRNQGKRTFNYLEDSYDEYEDDPSRLSVSSRGRLRKMTKRARANRTDD